jgi:hypothetical protein
MIAISNLDKKSPRYLGFITVYDAIKIIYDIVE